MTFRFIQVFLLSHFFLCRMFKNGPRCYPHTWVFATTRILEGTAGHAVLFVVSTGSCLKTGAIGLPT